MSTTNTVVLTGRRGGTTHVEVQLLATLPRALRLIGGLAVMCRVGSPHRTTVDVDALARGLHGLHDDLAGLALTDTGGGQYRFDGDLDLDVIDVSPDPAEELTAQLLATGEPLTDLDLNIVALTWAHDSATELDIVAVDERSGERIAQAPERLVASITGLVAMKSTAIPLRASTKPEKRASDLYDLSRLLVVRGQAASLADVPVELGAAVAERLTKWFVDDAGRDRTFREIRRFDEPSVDLDEVADAVEDLTSAT